MAGLKCMHWGKVVRILICLIVFVLVGAGGGKRAGAYENGDFVFSVKNGMATITSYRGDENDLRIPAALNGYPVIKIGDKVFSDNEDLDSIRLPEGLQVIGKKAFYLCDSLESITIPESVTQIGDDAFQGCERLRKVKFAGKKKITFGKRVFMYTDIVTIDIPAGTESLPEGFAVDTPLKKVILPASIKRIGAQALRSWNLKEVVFTGSVAQWKAIRRETTKSIGTIGEWNEWIKVKTRCKDGTIYNGKVTGAAAKKKSARLLKAPTLLRAGAGKKAEGKLVLSWKKVSGAAGYVVSRRNTSAKKWEVVAVTKKTSAAVDYQDRFSAGIAGDTRNFRTDIKYMVQAIGKDMLPGTPAVLKYEYPNQKRQWDGYLIHIGKDYYDPLIRYMAWRTGKNVDGFEVKYTVSYIPKAQETKRNPKEKTIHKVVRMDAEEDQNRLELGSYEEFVNITVEVRPYKNYKNGYVYGPIYSRSYDDSRYLQQAAE